MKVRWFFRPWICFWLTVTWTFLWANESLSHASTVWNGPLITYNQPTPDPTQVSNQDRITPVVWLTRAMSKGLFNAYSEASASAFSPADTEWAFGTLSTCTSLQYTNWLAWLNGQSPTTLVGKQAVLHLISEDIYISIQFTFWASGNTGGFTYARSTPPPLTIWPLGITNGQFSFSYPANPDFTYQIQSSTNLISWWPLATNVASTNPMTFFEPINMPRKYYRVLCLSNP